MKEKKLSVFKNDYKIIALLERHLKRVFKFADCEIDSVSITERHPTLTSSEDSKGDSVLIKLSDGREVVLYLTSVLGIINIGVVKSPLMMLSNIYCLFSNLIDDDFTKHITNTIYYGDAIRNTTIIDLESIIDDDVNDSDLMFDILHDYIYRTPARLNKVNTYDLYNIINKSSKIDLSLGDSRIDVNMDCSIKEKSLTVTFNRPDGKVVRRLDSNLFPTNRVSYLCMDGLTNHERMFHSDSIDIDVYAMYLDMLDRYSRVFKTPVFLDIDSQDSSVRVTIDDVLLKNTKTPMLSYIHNMFFKGKLVCIFHNPYDKIPVVTLDTRNVKPDKRITIEHILLLIYAFDHLEKEYNTFITSKGKISEASSIWEQLSEFNNPNSNTDLRTMAIEHLKKSAKSIEVSSRLKSVMDGTAEYLTDEEFDNILKEAEKREVK